LKPKVELFGSIRIRRKKSWVGLYSPLLSFVPLSCHPYRCPRLVSAIAEVAAGISSFFSLWNHQRRGTCDHHKYIRRALGGFVPPCSTTWNLPGPIARPPRCRRCPRAPSALDQNGSTPTNRHGAISGVTDPLRRMLKFGHFPPSQRPPPFPHHTPRPQSLNVERVCRFAAPRIRIVSTRLTWKSHHTTGRIPVSICARPMAGVRAQARSRHRRTNGHVGITAEGSPPL